MIYTAPSENKELFRKLVVRLRFFSDKLLNDRVSLQVLTCNEELYLSARVIDSYNLRPKFIRRNFCFHQAQSSFFVPTGIV